MIEYSVFMTTNHLSKDEGAKAYAAAQVRDKLTTDKFVAHVASHNSVFSKGTIKGVLADVACCLREQLLNGNKVELDRLSLRKRAARLFGNTIAISLRLLPYFSSISLATYFKNVFISQCSFYV